MLRRALCLVQIVAIVRATTPPGNQEISKKIARGVVAEDLQTEVINEKGDRTHILCFLGHADRYDKNEEYRLGQDHYGVPRDLYRKVPRPGTGQNGPFRRVHAEPDFRSPGAPAEFDVDA